MVARRKKTEITKASSDKNRSEYLLPLISLRALIITPNSKLQITAARRSSIQAFKEVDREDSKYDNVAVFCQTNEADEMPNFDGHMKTGVACELQSLTEKNDGTVSCLIQGFKRIKLLEIVENNELPYR